MNTKTIFFALACGLGMPALAQELEADTMLPRKISLPAEPRFYINVHTGVSKALGSTFRFYPDDISSITVTNIENNPQTQSTTFRSPSKGLGDGIRYGLGFSYVVNDVINVGIDLDYFSSTISKVKDSTYRELNTTNGVDYTYRERYTIEYDASLLTIAPNITFKAISRRNYTIYNKLGPVLTIRPNSIQRERQDINVSMGWQGFTRDSTAQTSRQYDWGIRNPAFGFMGAIGIQFRITEKVRAFAEGQFSHILFRVRSRSLEQFTVNGDDRLNSLSVAEREIRFEKALTMDENSNNPNTPTRAIVQRFPITYVGLQAGIAYRF